jgi:hypothetical protein
VLGLTVPPSLLARAAIIGYPGTRSPGEATYVTDAFLQQGRSHASCSPDISQKVNTAYCTLTAASLDQATTVDKSCDRRFLACQCSF